MVEILDIRAERTAPIGGYVPIRTYAYIALICFGAVSAMFWFRLIRRWPRYMLVLCIGSTAMAAGFVMRIILAGSPYSLGIYIVEDLFILLSPCFFLAANYIILSRLAVSLSTPNAPVSATCLFLPATRIAKIFVWSDGITFFIQASGGGMSATPSMASTGQKISLLGLILQLLSYVLYTLLLLVFGFRVRQQYPEVWDLSTRGGRKDWRVLFYATSLSCIGILVRSVFRIAEFSQGYSGYITTHEAYFYCFDSIPLILAIGIYMFVWPPSYTHQEHGMDLLQPKATNSSYQLTGSQEDQMGPPQGVYGPRYVSSRV